MNHHVSKPWITAAAALTLASSGWAWQSTSAQQTPEEVAARRRAYEQRQAEARGQQGTDLKHEQDAETRALYGQELAHRQRLARIERLKTLLRARGDSEKLGKLEELAAKEQTRYQAYLGKQREKMGAQRFGQAQSALEQGRERGKNKKQGAAHESDRARAERERAEARAERERSKVREQSAQSPAAQHPAAQRPSAQRPGTVPPRHSSARTS